MLEVFGGGPTIYQVIDMLPAGRQQQVLAICDAVDRMQPQWSKDHKNAASLLVAATLSSATFDAGQLSLSASEIKKIRSGGRNAGKVLGSVGVDVVKRIIFTLFF